MSTLFSNNQSDNGYRLRYLEVFNWGTFNGKVYKLQPDGRTSLLTGANGSGKTTLIDALLTLLVPTHKRFYNQSSGAESKKERDENSYFWGYHRKIFSEAKYKSFFLYPLNKLPLFDINAIFPSFLKTIIQEIIPLQICRQFLIDSSKDLSLFKK